jgi:hypothetical protein
VACGQGREGWVREGKRQLEQHRWENPDPIPRSRRERLLLSAERLETDLDAERRSNEALSGLSCAGAHARRAAVWLPAQPLHAAGSASREGEHHRP